MRPEALSLPTRGSRFVGLLFEGDDEPVLVRAPAPPPVFFSPPPHPERTSEVAIAAAINEPCFIVSLLCSTFYKTGAGDVALAWQLAVMSCCSRLQLRTCSCAVVAVS